MTPIEVAASALERNLGWVRTADEKVPPVFAVNAAMLGVLSLQTPYALGLSAATMAAVALMISMVFLGCVTFPSLSGPTDSIVFFGTAAKMKEADYIARLVDSTTLTDLTFDLARQAFRNAEIAKRKYFCLKLAMVSLFAAVPFWLAALLAAGFAR